LAVIDRAPCRREGEPRRGAESIGRTARAQIGDEAGGCAAGVSTGTVFVAGLDVPFAFCDPCPADARTCQPVSSHAATRRLAPTFCTLHY
jgi:hypothetical protein